MSPVKISLLQLNRRTDDTSVLRLLNTLPYILSFHWCSVAAVRALLRSIACHCLLVRLGAHFRVGIWFGLRVQIYACDDPTHQYMVTGSSNSSCTHLACLYTEILLSASLRPLLDYTVCMRLVINTSDRLKFSEILHRCVFRKLKTAEVRGRRFRVLVSYALVYLDLGEFALRLSLTAIVTVRPREKALS